MMERQAVDDRFLGPWPGVNDLVLGELDSYLADAARPELRAAETSCPPWNGDQLTAHVLETFRRFEAMLAQSRRGDFTPPFERAALSEENLQAVDRFEGDPVVELRAVVERFCAEATDPDELMAHQFGPIPVGLQATFGLAELALHHDDLVVLSGRRYRPDDETVAVRVATSYQAVMEVDGLVDAPDVWTALLAVSNRAEV